MSRARILAFAQLLRIPNVFIAFADVALGACVAAALLPSQPVEFWLAYVAFTRDLTDAVATLTARYHHATAPRGRPHRLVIASYPAPDEARR